jgi:quinol monooxygenase YgiN
MLCFMGAYLTLVGLLQGPLRAQAPPADGARYAVAYVEVQSTAVSALRSAFDRYRTDSRLEGGFGNFELLQQSGNPSMFVIVERWRDQASIDAHAKADATKRFRDALTPIRASGYDERPYKDFAIGTAAAASGEAVFVVTHIDVAPPGDAVTLLKRLADESRAEPGCLRFDILQHAQRANHFTIVEAWRTRAARDRHAAATHTRQYRDALQPMIGSPLDERLMRLP